MATFMSQKSEGVTRRQFVGVAGATVVASASSTGATGFPAIVPASVLGANSPGNRINVGAIGNGRISRGHDLPGLWKHDSARIMRREGQTFTAGCFWCAGRGVAPSCPAATIARIFARRRTVRFRLIW